MTKSVTLAPGEILEGTGFKMREFQDLYRLWSSHYGLQQSFDPYNQLTHPTLPKIKLSSQDITRWKMAWRAVQAFPEMGVEEWTSYPAVLTSRCRNRPEIENLFKKFWIALSFSAAAIMYGGLHVLAWKAHFDSPTEKILWRSSACIVMGGIPVGLLLSRWLDQCKKKFHNGHATSSTRLLLVTVRCLEGLTLMLYISARTYLVFECFANLSHLSADVFKIPAWTAYFPHIS